MPPIYRKTQTCAQRSDEDRLSQFDIVTGQAEISLLDTMKHTTCAKKLHLDPARVDTTLLQVFEHLCHERCRPTDVEFCPRIVKEEIFLPIEFLQIHPSVTVEVDASLLMLRGRAGEEGHFQVLMLVRERSDMILESSGAGAARTVYEVDLSLGMRWPGGEGVQYREQWREANAGGEENNGMSHVIVRQVEVTKRMGDFNHVTFVLEIVEDVRHIARVRFGSWCGRVRCRFLFDADPVVV